VSPLHEPLASPVAAALFLGRALNGLNPGATCWRRSVDTRCGLAPAPKSTVTARAHGLPYNTAEDRTSWQGRLLMSTVITNIRIPASLQERYDQLAKATGRTRNDLMAEALERYLAREGW